MLFDVPMLNNPDFRAHEKDGRHRAAIALNVCGPCFFGAHNGCEGSRSGQAWRCKCSHRELTLINAGEARLHEMTIVWSDWIAAHRPSEINQ
jgi:hypothetical protein